MIKAPVYNSEGKKIKEIQLPAELFEIPLNSGLVSLAVTTHLGNIRRSTAQTTDRGERRGGGRKPWKQKGTGRARHGSVRSPLWRKGGVTFGPTTDRNFHRKINKKARRKALFMILSDKARNKRVLFFDSLDMKKIKTKAFVKILNATPAKDHTTLVVTKARNKHVFKSSRNLQNAKTIVASQMNVFDALRYQYLVVEQPSLEVWKKMIIKKAK